ncbi:hypothetical protein FSP39_009071 [Pinctada imbricata]|uniref:PLAT domain-containing protein n=1 Tax=Pinctada imbricata TaxID=66713 RepID=A0AA88Y895_PINIB|nr:hypothetical protein FSP39_009071 [Pinctada imbricata]
MYEFTEYNLLSTMVRVGRVGIMHGTSLWYGYWYHGTSLWIARIYAWYELMVRVLIPWYEFMVRVGNGTSLCIVRVGRIYGTSWSWYQMILVRVGSKVSNSSTLDYLYCECDHFSVFSGGIFVAPVMVDPTDVQLFLTFFSNPVIVCAVITLWIVYFILLLWARKVDKREFYRGGVSVLKDNTGGEHYSYLIGVVTGWWRHAGTTANVYMYMRGSRGQSARKALKGSMTEHFQSGNEDWFLMSMPSSIGSLKEITIWHDNNGVDPAWFLKQVVVRDIQTKQTWNFLFNDWLALDRGRRTLQAKIRYLSDQDLHNKIGYNFMLKSSKDIQSQHLWVSIFSCPPESTFTRAQRLSVALSLLLLTMLTSLMFHGIPTDDPEDQLKHGDISFSLSDIIIGIQSGLIMFPINIIIMQLFTRLSPRRRSRPLSTQKYEEEKSDEEYIDKDTLQRLGVDADELDGEEEPVMVSQSLSKRVLKSIRKRLKLESEMAGILREIIFYFLFVFVVLFMVHGHQDVNTVYLTNKVIEDIFVHGLYEGDFPLDDVDSADALWDYLSESVGGNLFPGTEAVSSGGCKIASEMEHLYKQTPCKEEYWEGDEDERSYNKSWNLPVVSNDSNTQPDHWTYQSAWQLKTIAYMGTLATYAGSGFVIELPSDRNNFDQTLQDLQSYHWVDRGSSALFIEFNLYNPNVNLLTVVMILFEFSSTGSVLSSYQLFTTKLYMYQNGLEIFTAVCESFFVLFTLYFTCVEVKYLRKQGRSGYFSDTWSYIEVSIIVLSYSAIGVFAQKMIAISSIMTEYRNAARSSFTNFHTAVIWSFTLSYILAFMVLLVILKLFKLLRFNPKTRMLNDTLKSAGKSLFSTLLVIFIVLLAFAQFAVLLFGSKMNDYKDIPSALMALFNFSLGVSDYFGLEAANRVLGPFFFFIFCFLIQYILLVIFVAVLMLAFKKAQQKYQVAKGEKPVTWYIYNYIIRLAGFKKEKNLIEL